MQATYWSNKGKYQDQMSDLQDKLVPEEGSCETMHGELLRSVGRLYYDVYNNAYGNQQGLEYYKHVLLQFESELKKLGVNDIQWLVIKHGFNSGHGKKQCGLYEDAEFIEALDLVVDCVVLYCQNREQMRNHQ